MRYKNTATLFVSILCSLAIIPSVHAQYGGLNVVHAFTGTIYATTNLDGATPLYLTVSGNTLYGVALQGGTNDSGSVYRVNTDGSGFAILHSFTTTIDYGGANPDGAFPQGRMVLSGNTLYGTTGGGGSHASGTVFSINTDGSGFTNLYSFTKPSSSNMTNSDGSYPGGVLILCNDTLYGTADQGGAFGNGAVFAIHTDGSGFTNLYNFTAVSYIGDTNSDGAEPNWLALSGNTLYGTARRGGVHSYGVVFQINTDGSCFTNLHSFNNSDGYNPNSLIVSGLTLYGSSFYGGVGNQGYGLGTLFRLNTDGSSFTNLHKFMGFGDSGCPLGALALSGSVLYGVTDGTSYVGYVGAYGSVYAIHTDGSGFTNLYDFTMPSGSTGAEGANSDGASPTGGVVLSGGTLYGAAQYGGTSGNGTIFSVNTDGTAFANLHTFSALLSGYFAEEGAYPFASLILSGNTLYGTTADGGRLGLGTIFRVNTDGSSYTNLYEFTDGIDGSYPNGGLVLSGNTLYGTRRSGGSSEAGMVFAINTDGSGFTNLYEFTGDGDGANPEASLLLSGNTLYGTAENGGEWDSGVVFAINTDGSDFTTVYSFSAPDPDYSTNCDGANPYAGLILSGNRLYGTAEEGGTSGDGTVFAVNTDGSCFKNLYNFSYGADGGEPANNLVMLGSTLYSIAQGGNSGRGTIFSLGTDGSDFTTLYNFTATSGANATNADGAYPSGNLILSGNTLYGTAAGGGVSGNGTVFSFDTSGLNFTTLYNFTATTIAGANSDGASPEAGLVLAGNTLYGTAEGGGPGSYGFGFGTVFGLTLGASAPPPLLSITQAGGYYILSWPLSATNYGLQTASVVSSPSWSAISDGITNVGTNFIYSNTLAGDAAFFRLRAH